MKVVILAGGMGTRISEESHLRPKPMIEIGEMPIIWHIMKIYSYYGFSEFIICCGYKGQVIKDYFANYFLYKSDVTFDLANQNTMDIHHNEIEPWKVTLVDTGINNMTGSRVKQIKKFIPEGEPFLLTYGDGVSDVDIHKLLEHHKKCGKLATLTAVQPPAKFGVLDIDENNTILDFQEKPKTDGGWINGGFFVMEYEVFHYIDDEPMRILEREPLEGLANDKQLAAYKHYGFWQPMDTMRDKALLERLWKEQKAPWKVWGDEVR
ncbi:glucose-1-phosphate cytidylyltransferase [Parablautia muri]|uniref:Glucose-1-phosphate cytidylyltransferase n=1 Tax=Parablautia muri TaxID=2320879 RepID=A0A9X5BEV4_9FIRM|nr:glucose-1-phosphate cytidylyltransferase [Parablautia muri]NBJ92508.1 glucose-1-phosphate cytidylyltransferase [Parablautia muri]